MFQLIYVSTAARRFDDDELHALVEDARTKNERLGITGVLVYRNGSFLQVLESDEEETVRDLFQTIRADDRHQWITILKTSELDERDFPHSPLAFRDRSVAGVRQQPFDEEDELSERESFAYETLLQFQRDGNPSPAEGSPAEGSPEPGAPAAAKPPPRNGPDGPLQ